VFAVLAIGMGSVYASLGLRTISPTSTAIDFLTEAVRKSAESAERVAG
jgi:hypothetical protein